MEGPPESAGETSEVQDRRSMMILLSQCGLDLIEHQLFVLRVALRCFNAVFFFHDGPS